MDLTQKLVGLATTPTPLHGALINPNPLGIPYPIATSILGKFLAAVTCNIQSLLIRMHHRSVALCSTPSS